MEETDFEIECFHNPTTSVGSPYDEGTGVLKPNHYKCTLLHGHPAQRPPQPHPSARSGHFIGFSASLKKVFLYGGMGLSRSETCLNDTWTCCPETHRWSPLVTSGNHPTGTFGFAACFINNDTNLFVHGGTGPQIVSEAHVLDLRTGVWSLLKLREPIGRRWGHTANLIHQGSQQIIVMTLGDVSHSESTNDVITVSIPSGEVHHRQCGPIQPKPRRRHTGGLIFNCFVLIFGGRSAVTTSNFSESFFNDVWVLNTVTWEWCQLTSQVSPRTLREYYHNPENTELAAFVRAEATFNENEPGGFGGLPVRTGAASTFVGSNFYTFGGFGATNFHMFTIVSLFRYCPLSNKWFPMDTGLTDPASGGPPRNPSVALPPLTMCAMCWLPSLNPQEGHLYLHGGRWQDDPIRLHYELVVPRTEALKDFAADVVLMSDSQLPKELPSAVSTYLSACTQNPPR